MGKSLTYCFKCNRLIREEEFVKGKAFNLGDRYSCSTCAREVGAVVVPGAVQPPPPPPPPSTSRKVIVIREPVAAKSRMPMIAGAIVVAGALIAGVLALSDRSEPPAPASGSASSSPREPAVRQAPPSGEAGADLKAKAQAMEKTASDRERKQREVRQEAAKLDPDLVGHYPFDEGQGSVVQDSTGRGSLGEIKGATWTEGRIGKALRFDGKSYVELPNTPDFDTLQENSYTVAAWFKPEADPPPKEGFQAFAIVMKEGRHEGILMKDRFSMEHWLYDGTTAFATSSNPPYSIGRFYHVAGVVDRPQGLTRIVIDGKVAGQLKFRPGGGPWDLKKIRWRIGTANTNPTLKWSYPAVGVIDDVRFYRRALNDEEIQRLIPK